MTGVPCGPIGRKPVPTKTHDRALAQGKGPRGPGINRFREKCKTVVLFHIFSTVLNRHSKIPKNRQGDHSNFEVLGCERGGEGPPLGNHLHSSSNPREIGNSNDRLINFFVFLENGSKPEAGETENTRNWRDRNRGFQLAVETVWNRTEPGLS